MDFLKLRLIVDLEYPMSVREWVTDTWLTHCAKRLKVAGLIPAEVADIFN